LWGEEAFKKSFPFPILISFKNFAKGNLYIDENIRYYKYIKGAAAFATAQNIINYFSSSIRP
jgi:hypothetical protein